MPVEVKGALAVRKALKEFEPDLAKGLSKELAAILKPIVKTARGYVPSNTDMVSGWVKNQDGNGRWSGDRGYEASVVKSGITYKTTPSKPNRNGFRSLVTIYNKSAAGAIYETAGRKSGMVGNFSPRIGERADGQLKGKNPKTRGRLIFRAYEENQGKARAAVLKAIDGAANKLNLRSSV
jgi:hypothetical protein